MFKKLLKFIGRLNPLRALRRGLFAFGNWRRGRTKKFDYVLMTLPASMPALAQPRDWIRQRVLGAPPMSLNDLEAAFQRIADDPRPKGIILILRGFSMPLADLQTLRESILRLKRRGKQVICYAQGYDTAMYYVASAADQILLQPGGELMTIGLRQEATFLKNALETIGIQLDSVAISPFKGAFDQFTREDISLEGRQQLEWLLDSRYEMIVDGIATGRKMSVEAVRNMIDTAPHLDEDALKSGFINGILNEEGFSAYLKAEHFVPWKQAEKILRRRWQKRQNQTIALLEISGTIIQGQSGQPPIDLPIPFIGGERVGDITLVQQIRRLMKDEQAAAVLVYINSPGGSAAASEAMTSALEELAKTRPMVAFMGNVAASGGYYVATPAHWIVAQPGTITGSIGVLSGKPVTTGALEKLKINRVAFTRGANADFFSDDAPFSPAQRDQMRRSIERIYGQFIGRVALSRKMSIEAVDAVGGGRVWTGAQALEHGLVDELGDLQTALKKVRELANLPEDAPLVIPSSKGDQLPPQLASLTPAAALTYLMEGLRGLTGAPQMILPFDLK
ncbi:MAG: signal peptide peptidase SppA [Chitinophagaceae bacterium]|nr:signal peptide peptidase SppA [Anaerolineae bacterium]